MDKDVLIISETPWLAIAAAILVPVGLIGWVMDASWVHVNVSSPVTQAVLFVVFFLLEIYMLTRGVWPRTLTVDRNKQQITIRSYCPYLYKPEVIPLHEVKKIRVGDYLATEGTGRMYGLLIIKHDGTEVSFGDWTDKNQKKHEGWRDDIAEFAGIDNITRIPGK